ncbi:Ser/Thr protein kinase RdoA (MazF antagonist) [Methylobacterium sp. RAS18]|nr:Ser/Thr protein kinase RdoA (MazF antagonist) [Methylobacterium sp. RAS18]
MSDIDLHALSQCYGRVFAGCELVVPGANRTYRLTAGGDAYYLRLYRPIGRSATEIAFEMCLLREVQPILGIDVARPIYTVDGTDCTRVLFDGVDRAAGLFHALDGRPLSNNPEDVALFGSALAKLHRALARIDGGGARLLNPATLCAHSAVSLARIPGSEPVRRAVDRCRAEMLGDPAVHDLPSGNCHGDARLANVVAWDGTVGFFDFDDCGYGPYLLDLGTAAWHFVRGDPAKTAALIASLLAGYERVRPLSEAERQALPHFVKLAEIRALLFLAEFCSLTDDLWPRVLDRATTVLDSELRF